MDNKQERPTDLKDSMRQHFSTISSAQRKWWPVLEELNQPVSDHLVEIARIEPGHRVLDIGTGIGEPALTAARVVGAKGFVAGVDLAPEMIAVARQRAEKSGLANIEFYLGDAEALNLPPLSFDAVLSRFAINLMPDIVSALQGMRALLLPGGRMAAAVLGTPEKQPSRMFMLRAIEDVLGPDYLVPMNPRDEEYFERVLSRAGYINVSVETVTSSYAYASLDDFIVMSMDLDLTATANPQARDALYESLRRSLWDFQSQDGRVTLVSENIFVVGTSA